VSSVQAQTITTSVTQLSFPSSAVAGSIEPIPVNVAIPYNNTKPGYWLIVGILDRNNTVVPGAAISSPNDCVNQQAQAICRIQLQSASGVENIKFRIGGIFANVQLDPGPWDLQVAAIILNTDSTVLARGSMLFTITLTPVLLTINLPKNATIWVDGSPRNGGVIPVGVGRHFVSVPLFMVINETIRLRFDRWSDGISQPNRTVLISSSVELKPVYITQYQLIIRNPAPSIASGAGWYDDGSLAAYSVGMVEYNEGGFLGLIGVKGFFTGWFEGGRLITNARSGTIQMTSPHTLTASWRVDYTIPIIILSIITFVLGAAFLMVKRSGHKRRRSSPRSSRRRRSR